MILDLIFIINARKATRHIVDQWLIKYAAPTSPPNRCMHESLGQNSQGCHCSGSGAATPVRKISAHEFERGGLLTPIVNTIDGTPTFLSVSQENSSQGSGCSQAGLGVSTRPQRKSRHELQRLDEKDLIFELVNS